MPGKITDELRRITREQGGAGAEPEAPSATNPPPRARKATWIVVVGLVALAGLGWLLIDRLMEMSKIQDCAMSGRRNCGSVEVPPPGP